MHITVHVGKGCEIGRGNVDVFICPCHWHHDAGEVEHVDRCGIPIVLELVMSDGSRGSDGGNDCINLLAQLLLKSTKLGEVLHLVFPFLEIGVPYLVEVELRERRVDEILKIGDIWFA